MLDAPMDVIFDSNNVLQPDIIFVSKENKGILQKHIHGVPDLLIEIVSKNSVYQDYVKKNLYERFGVKEYWIADPSNETIVVLCLNGQAFQPAEEIPNENVATSRLLKGFSVDLSQIFPQ